MGVNSTKPARSLAENISEAEESLKAMRRLAMLAGAGVPSPELALALKKMNERIRDLIESVSELEQTHSADITKMQIEVRSRRHPNESVKPKSPREVFLQVFAEALGQSSFVSNRDRASFIAKKVGEMMGRKIYVGDIQKGRWLPGEKWFHEILIPVLVKRDVPAGTIDDLKRKYEQTKHIPVVHPTA